MEQNILSKAQENDVFGFLPEEVWLLVFDGIRHPSDLWACSDANKAWNNIIQSATATWRALQLYQILTRLCKMLTTNDLLKLRLVCKRWKDCVDCFVENDQNIMHSSRGNSFDLKQMTENFSFVHFQKVKLNFNKMNSLSRNAIDFEMEIGNIKHFPKIWSTICVADNYLHENIKVPQDLQTFFQKYGFYIRNLCLHLELVQPAQIFSYLQSLLQNTPNLSRFCVVECISLPILYPLSDISDDTVVPKLSKPFLLEVNVTGTKIGDFTLQQALAIGQSANVSELCLIVKSESALLMLKNAPNKLRKLSLKIQICRIRLIQVFNAVEGFKNSLKVLSICFVDSSITCKSEGKRLQLPHLEKLELMALDPHFSFSVLLDLFNLRLLSLHCWDGFSHTKEDIDYIPTELWECDNTEGEYLIGISKLWSHFKNLKMLRIYKLNNTFQDFRRIRIETMQNKLLILKFILTTFEKEKLSSSIEKRKPPNSFGNLCLMVFVSVILSIFVDVIGHVYGITGVLILVLLLTYSCQVFIEEAAKL